MPSLPIGLGAGLGIGVAGDSGFKRLIKKMGPMSISWETRFPPESPSPVPPRKCVPEVCLCWLSKNGVSLTQNKVRLGCLSRHMGSVPSPAHVSNH